MMGLRSEGDRVRGQMDTVGFVVEEAPAEGIDNERVNELHKQIVEYVAESDDALLEKFFENGSLSEDELRGHLVIRHQRFR